VRAADGRQERRGSDEGRDPLPPPLEQREGHPEPAIEAKGGPRLPIEREREKGQQVRMAGRRKAELRERERKVELLEGSLTQGGVTAG
jgi:hypothetical protein